MTFAYWWYIHVHSLLEIKVNNIHYRIFHYHKDTFAILSMLMFRLTAGVRYASLTYLNMQAIQPKHPLSGETL